MRDFNKTILSQFSNSQTILTLIEDINAWIDPDYNFDNFYNLLWNIDTAVGYGLDVWGRRVGVSRILQVISENYFGFAEANPDSEPFNAYGSFYNGESLTQNYTLSDEAFRLLIFAKAALNITNCSYPAINAILRNLFPNRGNCYVTDVTSISGTQWFGFAESGDATGFNDQPFFSSSNLETLDNMQLTYVFEFPLQPFEVSIVTTSGVLPKPVGVFANYSYQIA